MKKTRNDNRHMSVMNIREDDLAKIWVRTCPPLCLAMPGVGVIRTHYRVLCFQNTLDLYRLGQADCTLPTTKFSLEKCVIPVSFYLAGK